MHIKAVWGVLSLVALTLGTTRMPSAASPEIGKKLYDGALGALEQAVRALQSH